MGSLSIWHWLIVLLVAMIFFGGRGKITNVMGDFAKGIKAFKAGMKDEDKGDGKSGDSAAEDGPPKVTASPSAAEAQRPKEHA
jgi:sec-independent protein translocase protein TatA